MTGRAGVRVDAALAACIAFTPFWAAGTLHVAGLE